MINAKKIFVGLFMVSSFMSLAMAGDDGAEWLKSAPAFCRSEPYSNLSPKQMSKCDEAAFRHLSKHWKTIKAVNGQTYEVALDTVQRDLPSNVDPRAKLRAATVVVYVSEGDTFDIDNVVRFYFDCHDRYQTSSRSVWSSSEYAPPLSIAAKISLVACTQTILRNNQDKPTPIINDKSYDPIPPAWNIKIGLPGTLSVGAQYCTESGKCQVVGSDIVGLTIGGTEVGGVQGCQLMPDAEPCLKARIPVEVLVESQSGVAIVRLQDKNYSVSGLSWYKKGSDGSYIGGPVSVIYQGISIPLQMYHQIAP